MNNNGLHKRIYPASWGIANKPIIQKEEKENIHETVVFMKYRLKIVVYRL